MALSLTPQAMYNQFKRPYLNPFNFPAPLVFAQTKRAKIKGARKIKGREFRKNGSNSVKSLINTSKLLFLETFVRPRHLGVVE